MYLPPHTTNLTTTHNTLPRHDALPCWGPDRLRGIRDVIDSDKMSGARTIQVEQYKDGKINLFCNIISDYCNLQVSLSNYTVYCILLGSMPLKQFNVSIFIIMWKHCAFYGLTISINAPTVNDYVAQLLLLLRRPQRGHHDEGFRLREDPAKHEGRRRRGAHPIKHMRKQQRT